MQRNDRIVYTALLGGFFLSALLWAYMIPFNDAPDEGMRYTICQYIYRHGTLPRGDAAEIRNSIWGLSYGFTPILSYMVGAVFMKAGNLIAGEAGLAIAARLVSVLFSVGTAYYTMRIARRIWPEPYAKILTVIVIFLPQFIFISSYVNNDAMGIFTVAWTIFNMLDARDKKWSCKSCCVLGVSIGVCLLSYYNCYGVILIALLYSVVMVFQDCTIDNKGRFILIRVVWVAAAAFVVAGWWFIRNAILYDGDFSGLRASQACGEQYAQDGYKPSQRDTPHNMGQSLKQMLVDRQWLYYSFRSYIAGFGYQTLWLPDGMYAWMGGLCGIGLAGNFVKAKQDIFKGGGKRCFYLCMVLMCLITIGLSMYYSFFVDMQAQGRYCLPMCIPLGILVVGGWQKLSSRFPRPLQSLAMAALLITFEYCALYSSVEVILAAYW
ncbi:MAG: glycosyltransferase family 39 protein [Roseburia sp.]|nr:glycosyltransferase family 39 protein [Roseburia sp.]